MIYFLQNLDIKILKFINNHLRCKLLDILMPFITSLGNFGLIWVIVSLYLINNENYRYEGCMIIISLILTTLVGEGIIKHIFRRTRPYANMKHCIIKISKPITYSFPSGHSASSFAAAGIFSMMNSKASFYMLILASLIAFSRLYLNVHYPSDVIIGIILGIICSKIVMDIFYGFLISILHIYTNT